MCFVGIGQYWQYWLKYNYLKVWNLRVQKKIKNTEKIAFKVVQAMHIINQKLSFDIFTVEKLQNIFKEQDLYLKT